MQARLVKNEQGDLILLCANGEIRCFPGKAVIGKLLFHFKTINVLDDDLLGREDAEKWNTEYPEMSSYPGETMAYVTDAFHLVIVDFSPSKIMFEVSSPSLDDLLTVSEYANLHNKSVEQVKVFCRTGRIPGAKKIGRDWVIPSDTPYPLDNRVASGRYVNNKK